ncbi:NifB/NifX family molybdenum-iron cluster-binding protein [Thermoproteota archaeon]
MLIAVASQNMNGLNDIIPQLFGRSPAFTIIKIKNGIMEEVIVQRNTSAKAEHGAGPTTCMRLKMMNVDTIIAAEFGPTVSTILTEAKINMVEMKAGTKVKDAINQYLMNP